MKKSELRQMIKEELLNENGGMKLLNKVRKDWGSNSDLYYEIEDALVSNVGSSVIKNILDNYDVLDDYKKYLKYI